MKVYNKRNEGKFLKKIYRDDTFRSKQKKKGNVLIIYIAMLDSFFEMFLLLFLSNKILHICAFWKIAIFYLPALLSIYSLQFLLLKFIKYEVLTIFDLQFILTEFFDLFHLSLNIFLLFSDLIWVSILYYGYNIDKEIKIISRKIHISYFISYF
ncbi:hypothetical protein TUBRATIS_28410 [Tubulinosema ratisbonensis]|uniref:Uncharacterized protein n=1 Tax=Tubulinosema ratisbonensis TaxID=291195 RepID=A0A437AI16_9MICR|nr:hypothetical protein TUBRATIS_28410 [Tubulinosema ratisbonensis]